VKLTREQLQGRKDKAVRFTESVLRDPDRAAEIEDESLDDYADRRHIQITNPSGRKRNMATTPKTDLQDRVDELEAENEALRDQLDSIAEIVAPDDTDEDVTDEEDEDDDEEEEDDDPN
jgi:ribonuclease E